MPIVVFPRINAAHARQPSWGGHIAALQRAGVHLIMGDDVWPLHEPRSAPGKELPWAAIIDTIVSRSSDPLNLPGQFVRVARPFRRFPLTTAPIRVPQRTAEGE